MKIKTEEIKNRLSQKGLKVTPQRLSVLSAIYELENHPSAEQIMDYLKENDTIYTKGTVYKVLNTLVECGLLHMVNSERDNMRYDGNLHQHHHIYCSENNTIEDYFDEELNDLLNNYFKKKKMQGFKVEDITLQIKGKHTKS